MTTSEYQRAQYIANGLCALPLKGERVATLMQTISALQTLSGAIAKTILKGMKAKGSYAVSSKQAWALACAIVEHNIKI